MSEPAEEAVARARRVEDFDVAHVLGHGHMQRWHIALAN